MLNLLFFNIQNISLFLRFFLVLIEPDAMIKTIYGNSGILFIFTRTIKKS